jgi:hypothetical protein
MIVDPMTEVTGLTKFDIYFEDKRWPCAIYLSEEEVAALMKANGVSDVRALVDIYGLTLLDLPYPMIVDRALPRMLVYFFDRRSSPDEKEFFNLWRWRTGLG